MAPCVTGNTYFAVHDDHHSVAEVATATVKYIGNGATDFIPWPESRKRIEVGDAIFTNDRIKKELGWSPATSLKSGLEATREYYLPRLNII